MGNHVDAATEDHSHDLLKSVSYSHVIAEISATYFHPVSKSEHKRFSSGVKNDSGCRMSVNFEILSLI